MKFADFLQDFLHQGKEQARVRSEPDPEEKDDNQESATETEDKIITDALYNSVIKCQYHVEANSVFNVQLSGTTFTSGFFNGNQLYTCNVGDSRVILISLDSDGKVKTKSLTIDHKPDNPEEKIRIAAVGGKVAQAQDWRGRFSGPQRIWVKNINSPGLAMSRSVGDTVAHSVGCACEPELHH